MLKHFVWVTIGILVLNDLLLDAIKVLDPGDDTNQANVSSFSHHLFVEYTSYVIIVYYESMCNCGLFAAAKS